MNLHRNIPILKKCAPARLIFLSWITFYQGYYRQPGLQRGFRHIRPQKGPRLQFKVPTAVSRTPAFAGRFCDLALTNPFKLLRIPRNQSKSERFRTEFSGRWRIQSESHIVRARCQVANSIVHRVTCELEEEDGGARERGL